MKNTVQPIAGTGSVKIVNAFRSILLVANFTDTDGTEALTDLATVKFKIERRNQQGIFYVVPELLLLDVLECSSIMGASFIEVKTLGADTAIEGTILIGLDGDVHPVANEEYYLTLTGIPNRCSIDVYTLETKEYATQQIEYSLVKADKGIASPIDINQASYIAMKKADLRLLELQASNGVKLALEPAEVREHLRRFNPSCINMNGSVIPGGHQFYNFPCASSVKAYVTPEDDSHVIITKVRGI